MLKRILCLDQFATLGGAQQCLLDLIPFFDEGGCQVEVVLPGMGPFSDKLRDTGCTLRFFSAAHFSRKQKPVWEAAPYYSALRSASSALRQSVHEGRPDVLYVNGPRFLPAAALVAWHHDIPLLFHAHNRVLQKGALRLLGRALRISAAQVIACCEYVAASLRQYVEPSKMRIVYNGSADLHVQRTASSGSIKTIGVIGRISPEKGQLNLLRALQLLDERSLQCVIVGAPSTESIAYYRDVLKESKKLNVHFPGWSDDARAAIAGLDLLVVPSLTYDAAPRVILEAFSAGVPVLACPSGGIPELIEDNVTGFLTPGSTPGQIADRLAEVLQMPLPILQPVVTRARQTWFERFSLEQYRRGIWNVVQSCVAA